MYDFLIWWVRGYELEQGLVSADDEIDARIELALWHYPENVTIMSICNIGKTAEQKAVDSEIRIPLLCFGRALPNACLLEISEHEYAVIWKGEHVATIARQIDGLQALCDWFTAQGFYLK